MNKIIITGVALLAFTIFTPSASARCPLAYRTNTTPVTDGNCVATSTGSNSGSNGSNGSNGSTNNGTIVIVPDSKPFVSTEPAMDIKTTSALIQGAAHVDSGTANVWFEWGTRVDKLDHSTRSLYIDSMSTGSSEMLTNLTPGTKYFYRIVAHNSTGTCYGMVMSFTTSKTGTSTKSTGSKVTVVKTASAATSSSESNSSIKGSLSAAAANAHSGNGVVPTSIIGWMIVIILVFLIVIVVRKIQRDAEERKKREEEAKKAKS